MVLEQMFNRKEQHKEARAKETAETKTHQNWLFCQSNWVLNRKIPLKATNKSTRQWGTQSLNLQSHTPSHTQTHTHTFCRRNKQQTHTFWLKKPNLIFECSVVLFLLLHHNFQRRENSMIFFFVSVFFLLVCFIKIGITLCFYLWNLVM